MSGMTATEYLMLPWSIRGPLQVTDEHGNRHFEMRVGELPDFFVAGESENEVLYEFKKALLAFLESYVSEGEEPPHPEGDPVVYVSLPRRESPSAFRMPAGSQSGNRFAAADLVPA
jgi:predicted RNase H-like HicB family nuclease